jgi:hypothetical protein
MRQREWKRAVDDKWGRKGSRRGCLEPWYIFFTFYLDFTSILFTDKLHTCSQPHTQPSCNPTKTTGLETCQACLEPNYYVIPPLTWLPHHHHPTTNVQRVRDTLIASWALGMLFFHIFIFLY